MNLDGEARKLIAANAIQVRDYVTLLRPRLERSGQLPSEPLGKKARGSSNTPVSEKLYDLIDANREEMRLLEPLLSETAKSRAAPRGYRQDVMLSEVWSSPGCETRWPPARQRAFDAMFSLLAYKLWQREPEARLSVVLSTKKAATMARDVKRPSEHAASSKKEARKHDVRESYRRIVWHIEALEVEGYTREEAKMRMMEELDCGRTRIRDALSFVNAEREDPVRANEEWKAKERLARWLSK